MRSWKHCERRVAEILGGRRVPVSGRGRGDAPDIAHPALAVEVKSRRTLPGWLKVAMEQAKAARVPPQMPVAVLHEDGERYADSLVVVRLGDFVRRLDCKCYAPDGGAEKEE